MTEIFLYLKSNMLYSEEQWYNGLYHILTSTNPVNSKSVVLFWQKKCSWSFNHMILQLTRLIWTFFSPVELFLSVNIRLIYSNSTLLLASITIYVWSKNRVSPSLREERCPFRRQVPEVWSDEREGLLVLWTFSQVVVESLSGVTHYTSFQSGQRPQKSVHYWPFFTLSIFSCNKN